MWLPENAEEIEQLAQAGALQETATFDAKKELTKDSREIAKDIAAMANDGGVLLYGIDEDATGRPTILNPIQIIGEPERINKFKPVFQNHLRSLFTLTPRMQTEQ